MQRVRETARGVSSRPGPAIGAAAPKDLAETTWFPKIAFRWLVTFLDLLAEMVTRDEALPQSTAEMTERITYPGMPTVRVLQILKVWGVVNSSTQTFVEETFLPLIRPETRVVTLRDLLLRQFGSDLDVIATWTGTRRDLVIWMAQRWRTGEEMARRGVRFLIAAMRYVGYTLPSALADGAHSEHYVHSPQQEARGPMNTTRHTGGNGVADHSAKELREVPTIDDPSDDPIFEPLRAEFASAGIVSLPMTRSYEPLSAVHTDTRTPTGSSERRRGADLQVGQFVAPITGSTGSSSTPSEWLHVSSEPAKLKQPGQGILESAIAETTLGDQRVLSPEAHALTRRFTELISAFPADAWSSSAIRTAWLDQLQLFAMTASNLAQLMRVVEDYPESLPKQ